VGDPSRALFRLCSDAGQTVAEVHLGLDGSPRVTGIAAARDQLDSVACEGSVTPG
jgi:hypothetical protein